MIIVARIAPLGPLPLEPTGPGWCLQVMLTGPVSALRMGEDLPAIGVSISIWEVSVRLCLEAPLKRMLPSHLQATLEGATRMVSFVKRSRVRKHAGVEVIGSHI